MTDLALSFVRDTYVDGNCHFLARCLAEKTGWPVATILNGEGEHAFHAFVITPQGQGLDIDGLHDVADLSRQWGGSVINGAHHAIIEGDLGDEFDEWGSTEGYDEESDDIDYDSIWVDAEDAALMVLAHYLPGQFPEDE